MRKRWMWFFALAVVVSVTARSLAQRAPATLGIAGRANANVSLAAVDAVVAAAWSVSLPGGAADIYAALSRDGGVTFAPPVRVNTAPGEARVNGEQPPRIALSARAGLPEIAVVWTAKGAIGTTMVSARSSDGGRTFTPPALVPGTDAPGNRGWEALGTAPQGRFLAVWLDHRRLAAPEAVTAAEAHAHDHRAMPASGGGDAIADADAMAAKSQLFVASLDGTIRPQALTGGVCYCCKTAVARSGETIVLAWRHVYPGSLRDIAVTVSRDGGRTFAPPVRVSEDKWQINGCPDDGPALVLDRDRRIHVVWPTVLSEGGGAVKALFHAESADGLTFSPRLRIPTEGQANHPQMTMRADGGLVVAWDETGHGPRTIAMATGARGADGRLSFKRTTANGVGPGTYPALAATPRGVVMAWTAGDPAASVIATARLP